MIFKRKKYDTIKDLFGHKQIITTTAIRRVRKTSLMQQISNKLDDDNKVFLDMESASEQLIFDEIDYNNFWNTLLPFGISKNTKAYIIDKVQQIPSVVKTTKYLCYHYGVKFMVNSSSSFYLKSIFPKSLAGWKFVVVPFPLNFKELMVFKSVELSFEDLLEKKSKRKIKNVFEKYKTYHDKYLEYGRFPLVVLAESKKDKQWLLTEIFISYFEKNVKCLTGFKQIKGFRDLTLLLLKQTDSNLNISKLASVLILSRPTVYSHLYFLEHPYFNSNLKSYSGNIDKDVSGASKVYICDTGIVNKFAMVDERNLFENAIYNNLKSYGKINYYQNCNGSEINFIIREKGIGIEAKTKAIKQHLQKTERLSNPLKLNEFYMVSKEFSKEKNVILALNL